MAKGKFVKALIDMAEKSGLDMSEAARMQRAKDMGFDVENVMLHGTNNEFDAFDPNKYGENFGDAASKYGAFFTNSEKQANRYGDNIGEYLIGGKLKNINARNEIEEDYKYLVGKGEFNGSFDDFINDFAEKDPYGYYELGALENGLSSAKKEGFEGVNIDFSGMPNIYGSKQNVRVAFDPKNIRSVNAAFDPAKKESSNLLAGAATVGGIAGASTLAGAPQKSYADTLHDIVMSTKPTTREIMDAQKKREDYLAKIEALNDAKISSPDSNSAIDMANFSGEYNKYRKQHVNPVLDMLLPFGELPQEYFEKIGYGDEITMGDRINAILGIL